MLSFTHVKTWLKWLLLNSELQFRVFPCSSTSWVTAKKRLFLHKWKPNLSNWRKGKPKACFIYWKVPFPNENTCSASHILKLFQEFVCWFFFFLFQSATVPFFKQMLRSFYSHAKGYPNHPSFTMPQTLDMPVLNTPGFNLRLNVGKTNGSAITQKWQSSLWQTGLA